MLSVLCVLAPSGCAQSNGESAGTAPLSHSHGPRESSPSEGTGADTITQTAVSLPSKTPSSSSTKASAMEFRDEVMANIAEHGWSDPINASKDGYRPMQLDPEHWYNPDFLTDGRQFDPAAPEILVIQDDQAVGTMFLAESFALDLPDPPGSPFIRWHYHRYSQPVCFADGIATSIKKSKERCPDGTVESSTSPAMAHVWLTNMDDPFTEDMEAYRNTRQ